MAEAYRFFDSLPEDPREYTADQFAEYFRLFLTDGILNGGENLQVSANGTDMRTFVKAGYAWIQGYMYKNTEDLFISHSTAHSSLNRIDRIVIRLDKTLPNRYIRAFVKEGAPAENPVPPSLQRDDNIWEISLAQVLIEAGKSFVEPSQITDERFDNSVCGLVNSLIQVDTATMQQRFDSWLESVQGDWQQWFEEAQQQSPASKEEVQQVENNLAAHLADNANPHNVTAAQIGAPVLGTSNQAINKIKALDLRIDTRNTVLTYDGNGRLMRVEEKDGETIVKTTNLLYDANGNLTQVEEIAGGTTVTTTLTYTNGQLTSVSKAVS
ncbi:MAG: hypothetical protein BAA01_09450 [Bacillus thermozeamaize]|uniref:Uncharacterized protein n=1 Tax=Bacillus thermozeamaize TaxID=230954 RepID=A0A1Y3PEF1_9BACI|nr:MAG: hypothetical protein BAA01_09450 [Bacillus thermozeamaize]